MAQDLYTLKLGDEVSKPASAIDRSLAHLQKTFTSLGGTASRIGSSMTSFARSAITAGSAVTALDVKSQKASKSTKTLGGILGSFGKTQVVGGIAGASGAMSGLVNEASNLGPGVLAGAAGLAVLGVAAFKIGQGVGRSVNVVEQLRAQLVTLKGSSAAADATLQTILKTTNELGGGFEETGKRFAQFLTQGFSDNAASFLTKIEADLSTLPGGAEAAKNAINQVTKALSNGKVTAETFEALRLAGGLAGPVLENVAKAIGKTTDQTKELLSQGKVAPEIFAAAFKTESLKKFGTATAGIVSEAHGWKTWEGILKNVKDAIFDNLFVPFAIKYGPAIISTIGSIAKSFTGMVDWIVANSSTLITTLKIVGLILTGVAAGFIAVNIAAIAAWAAALLPITLVIAGIAALSVIIFQLVKHWDEIVVAVGEMATGVMSWFSQLGTDILNWFTGLSLVQAGTDLVKGLILGISSAGKEALDTVMNLGSSILGAFKDVLGIASPSKEFMVQGKMIDEGLALGIDRHDDMVLRSASDVSEGAIQASQAELSAASHGPNLTNVGAAAGSSLASRDTTSSVKAPVTNNFWIDGSKSPDDIVSAVREFFDEEFSSYLERSMEGVGA